jgi:hypothetical protein
MSLRPILTYNVFYYRGNEIKLRYKVSGMLQTLQSSVLPLKQSVATQCSRKVMTPKYNNNSDAWVSMLNVFLQIGP